jgi:(p)ppGpp synthase/HD superfamily hydrolase
MTEKIQDTQIVVGIKHWIRLAHFIANQCHKEQYRRDKITPYIDHPIAVASRVEYRLVPIALLHDSLEDSDLKLADLIELDFPEYIVRAVEALTRFPDEDYMHYLQRVKENKDATAVKLADMGHNLSDSPTEKQKAKYAKAIEYLTT